MNMAGKNGNDEPQKGSEDPIPYHPTNTSSDWQLNGLNLTNTSACSSASIVDSFCAPIWDQPINGQNLSYCDVNMQNDACNSSNLDPVRAGMNWNPNAMLRGGVFLPSVPGLPPQNLPQFPADSGFIERAARFSCFSGGNFGEMMNPFSVPDTMNPFSRSLGPMQEVFGGTGSKPLLGMQPQRHEMLTADVSSEGDHGTQRSPLTNDKKIESVTRLRDDSKQGVNAMGNESDEAEFSGRGAQEELDGAAGESSGKGTGSKKRKRTRQDTAEHTENNRSPQPLRENVTDTAETKQKGDQNPTSSGNPGGNNVKQAGSQGSDPPKEDYIHVRARRGQATNSHSLAERVRREKISERMKFLQDLVPGCSKVTGKAVMLDEIINYVQSLQRQVEFLSMKLATVNPRLDFNIEGLLTKDILHPRAGLPSSLAFPPDMSMPFPSLHPSQAGLIPAGLQGLGNSSETLRRQINIHSTSMGGGFKESTSQVHGSWEDELHNIVHMGFNSNSSQDLSASLPPGHMKAEP